MAYKIKAKQLDAGVGSGMYSPGVDPNTQSTQLGGAESRLASEWSNYTVSQVLDELLFQYQKPSMAITQFLANGSPITTPREVGQDLTGGANVNITFTWDTNPPEQNAIPNSVRILDYKAPPALTGQPINGTTNLTYTNAELTPAGTGSKSWTARGTNTNNEDYSNGSTVSWAWRGYWGSSAAPAPTETLIKNLANKPLPATTSGTFSFPSTDNEYKYWAFPSGVNPSSFTLNGFPFPIAKEDEGFNLFANGYNYKQISITNAYNKTNVYNVYRSRNKPSGAINVVVG
jgi:hypothetical protein